MKSGVTRPHRRVELTPSLVDERAARDRAAGQRHDEWHPFIDQSATRAACRRHGLSVTLTDRSPRAGIPQKVLAEIGARRQARAPARSRCGSAQEGA